MTRYTPLWQQESSYNAIADRQFITGVWTNGGVQGAYITLSASAMTASIAAGTCVVPLTGGNGCEMCYWDAAETVTFTAANATNPRIDLIVCQVRDDAVDAGGQNNFSFVVVTGTAAASPVAPTTPVNAFCVAQVRIPANVTNLSTATLPFLGNLLDGGAQQAAVPAGAPFQVMTDSYGELWIAKGGVNGGAWKRPRDVLHCRYYSAATTAVQATYNIPWPTLVSDPYGLLPTINTTTFTLPLAGVWMVASTYALSATATGQWVQSYMVRNANSISTITSHSSVGVATGSTNVSVYPFAAGDTVFMQLAASVSLPMTGNPQWNNIAIDYLGTG